MGEAVNKDTWSITQQFSISKKKIWKVLNYLWIIAVVLLVIMGVVFVKNIFFPSQGDNVHKPWLIALPGSHIDKVDQSSKQKMEEKKRPWWQPIPFVEIYGGVQSRPKNNSVNFTAYDPEIGTHAGLRWDF